MIYNHPRRERGFLWLAVAALFAAPWAMPAEGAVRTWIGGDNDWNGSGLNWTGLDEPDDDDDAVFSTNNHVEMAIDNEVLSLTLSNSIALDTESFFLDVNGDVTLSGAGTILRAGESNTAGPPATSLSAYNVTVGANTTFANANFTSIIDASSIGVFEIETGGTLIGHGLIRNGDGITSVTPVFINDGVIRPGAVADGPIFVGGSPTARTLTLAAIDGEARIELDGVGGAGAVDITRNQTLDIDVQLSDAFDGVIDLAHNSTLDIEDAWTFSGTLNVENGFVAGNPPLTPNIPADVAFLRGGPITMTGGLTPTTVNVFDADGTLQFDAPLTANGGAIANNGHIIFNDDATINAGVDFEMIGEEASFTVGPGATVVINDADMDFDGAGAATNVITVEAGGLLDFNLDSFEGNDRADNFLTLNSGQLALTVTDGSWTMERRLTLNNTGGGEPTVTGSAIVVGDDAIVGQSNDADILVQGSGSSRISPNVTFNSDAEVDVEAGATLAVVGFSTFNSANGAENARFDGPGNIRFNGGQVNEATTLDFSGGTVGLDGGGTPVILLSAPDFTVDAPLTINAATFDPYGRTVNFPNNDTAILTVNGIVGGVLEVNLDNANDSWEINSLGVLNVIGSGVITTNVLSGSTLAMNGTMNADGLVETGARVVIGSTGGVSLIDAGTNLRISGGDLANPNRLEGGSITGPGELSANATRALHGFGTLGVAIDFDGNAELLADDGTLTLDANATLLDVGTLGTNDTDGTLNVVNAWNTIAANEVRLRGGSLVGGNITNDAVFGINGFGVVNAQVVNNSLIDADDGGTLFVINAANDWDGTTNTGTLHARFGDLELVDAGSFAFNGTVQADAGQTVFANGFELDFQPGSSLILGGGTYRSTDTTDLRGNVVVATGTSTLNITGSAVFRSNASVAVTGDLVLDNNTTLINAGATFVGGGSLINPAGSFLNLADGADVDVLIENEGELTFAGAGIGSATGDDLQLDPTGTIRFDLAGTALTDFDRLALTGLASLDGELEVNLLGAFNPAIGDQFPILTANAGVFNTFASLDLPALDPGEVWRVNYPNAITLVLEVVAGIVGDYNGSGQVEQGDLDLVLQNWGDPTPPIPAGWVNDLPSGIIDQGELDGVLLNWGDTAAPDFGAATTVPEPAAVFVTVMLGTALRRVTRRRVGESASQRPVCIDSPAVVA